MAAPIILFVHDLRGSGVVTNAIALARRLGMERDTILCAGYGCGLNSTTDVAPARLVVLIEGEEPRRADPVAARELRRLIATSRAGMVVSMGNLGHRTLFDATRVSRVRTIYRVSNEIGRPKAGWRKNFRRRNWHRRLLATADRIVLVGRALADQPLFARAISTGKAVYIANGVDVDGARVKARAPVPHPWLEDGGPPVVLAIGRVHPQKNLGGLIEGVALANRERPLRLLIIGSGEADRIDALKAQSERLGITGTIEFAGETDNVFPWLAHAAVFALVSHWEGSSNALLEALAVRTPIVASRQAGDAAHVLDGGRFGVLVDADDPRTIALGILTQVGTSPVTSGDRVDSYRLENTHAKYLNLLNAVAEK